MGRSHKDQSKYDKKQEKNPEYESKKDKNKKRPFYEETIEDSLAGSGITKIPKSNREMWLTITNEEGDEDIDDFNEKQFKEK
jgi:hypothetical protein